MLLHIALLLLVFLQTLIYFSLVGLQPPLYCFFNFPFVVYCLKRCFNTIVFILDVVLLIRFTFHRLSSHVLLNNFYSLDNYVFEDALSLDKISLVALDFIYCFNVLLV